MTQAEMLDRCLELQSLLTQGDTKPAIDMLQGMIIEIRRPDAMPTEADADEFIFEAINSYTRPGVSERFNSALREMAQDLYCKK